MKAALTAAGLLAAVLAGAAVSLSLPYAGFRGETFVDIPKGTGTTGMSRLLADAGAVRYRWQFLLARALRPKARLQAGEYRFTEASSVWRIFSRIENGEVFFYELTVPEGQNVYDIAASVDRLGVISAEEFLRAAGDASAIRDIAPAAPSLEGYLFPDTYRITRHTTAAELCSQMTRRFRDAWNQLGAAAPVHATVTLASLVEKETALAEERPLVASVFRNRLRIGMPLDCDPTAIYAALRENRYRGELYRSDLEAGSRYNTYRHAGLPPGPIANPGIGALKAVLSPAETKYLYFVARPDGSGGHHFSTELETHQRAVQRYRRANNKAQQTGARERIPRRSPALQNHRGGGAGASKAARPGL